MSENVQAVEEKRGLSQHWPVALLALAVVLIFAIAMMTFQVKETEYAVVKTLGKAKVDEAGQIITYEPDNGFKNEQQRIVEETRKQILAMAGMTESEEG